MTCAHTVDSRWVMWSCIASLSRSVPLTSLLTQADLARRDALHQHVVIVPLPTSDDIIVKYFGVKPPCLLYSVYCALRYITFGLRPTNFPEVVFASLTFATSCIVSHAALWLGTHMTLRVSSCKICGNTFQSIGKGRPQSLCQACFKVIAVLRLLLLALNILQIIFLCIKWLSNFNIVASKRQLLLYLNVHLTDC